ncbi:MAG: enoyl-CoA hydratase-related protein [Phycisphaerales bacterium]
MSDTPESLVTFETDGRVAVARFNRPKVLNALNPELMEQLADQLERWDEDPAIAVVVLTGGPRAFAAGADIGEMATRGAIEMEERDQFRTWDRIRRVRKPLVAAVNGFALGGGCELMMICDVIVAADTAQFGQPEIKLGVIPGAGGTQRLARAVGKAKAMDMVLTGRFMDAREAEMAGLVSRVVPPENVEDEAMNVARTIAGMGRVAARYAKEAVNKSWEMTLHEGIEHERKLFFMLFASQDQAEGMAAFNEKRRAKFTDT